MNGRMHPLVAVVAIVSGAWGCAAPAPARGSVATVEPAVLIYCDMSPGAVTMAAQFQKIADSQGRTWKYATNETQLTSRLNEGGWAEIYVCLKDVGGEPGFINALRNYANAHPEQLVFLFVWKPHAAPPAADRAVLGTMGMATWHRGQSAVGYAGARIAPETVAGAGLSYPTFDGVLTTESMDLGTFEATSEDDQTQAIIIAFDPEPIEPCLDTCRNEFVNEFDRCIGRFNARLTIIYRLYLPSETNEGDVVEFTKQINTATEDFQNCVAGAANTWALCVANCEAQGEGEGGG